MLAGFVPMIDIVPCVSVKGALIVIYAFGEAIGAQEQVAARGVLQGPPLCGIAREEESGILGIGVSDAFDEVVVPDRVEIDRVAEPLHADAVASEVVLVCDVHGAIGIPHKMNQIDERDTVAGIARKSMLHAVESHPEAAAA